MRKNKYSVLWLQLQNYLNISCWLPSLLFPTMPEAELWYVEEIQDTDDTSSYTIQFIIRFTGKIDGFDSQDFFLIKRI